jgi:hypothetical protein
MNSHEKEVGIISSGRRQARNLVVVPSMVQVGVPCALQEPPRLMQKKETATDQLPAPDFGML